MFILLFLIIFINFQPAAADPIYDGNSTLPDEYRLRELLVRAGCWPLNNVPEVFPILNRSELPLTITITPYFEIVTSVDDKAQTYLY